jgi:hypothetical protein
MLTPAAHVANVTAAEQVVESLGGHLGDLDATRAALASLATEWRAAEAELDALPRRPRVRLGEENAELLAADQQWEATYGDRWRALRDRQEALQVQFQVIQRRTNYQLRSDFRESDSIATFAA